MKNRTFPTQVLLWTVSAICALLPVSAHASIDGCTSVECISPFFEVDPGAALEKIARGNDDPTTTVAQSVERLEQINVELESNSSIPTYTEAAPMLSNFTGTESEYAAIPVYSGFGSLPPSVTELHHKNLLASTAALPPIPAGIFDASVYFPYAQSIAPKNSGRAN